MRQKIIKSTPVVEGHTQKKMSKAVQQLKYDGKPYQLVDPKNGPVAVIVHRGVPLAKDAKEVAAKNLCFHRVVTSRRLWMPSTAAKKKEVAAADKATYVRTVRTVEDGKSHYRQLTKSQKRKLYGKTATKDRVKLTGGIDVALYDAAVRRFINKDADKPSAKKRAKKVTETDAEKVARLEAELAKLKKT